MPGAKERNPIMRGLQPGLPCEDTPFKDPAKRNRPGRPKGSVNRYTGALKERHAKSGIIGIDAGALFAEGHELGALIPAARIGRMLQVSIQQSR
jgi:hypothetical protein